MASISACDRWSGKLLGTSRTGRQRPTSPGSIRDDEARTGIGAGHGKGFAAPTILRILDQRSIQTTMTTAAPRPHTSARSRTGPWPMAGEPATVSEKGCAARAMKTASGAACAGAPSIEVSRAPSASSGANGTRNFSDAVSQSV